MQIFADFYISKIFLQKNFALRGGKFCLQNFPIERSELAVMAPSANFLQKICLKICLQIFRGEIKFTAALSDRTRKFSSKNFLRKFLRRKFSSLGRAGAALVRRRRISAVEAV